MKHNQQPLHGKASPPLPSSVQILDSLFKDLQKHLLSAYDQWTLDSQEKLQCLWPDDVPLGPWPGPSPDAIIAAGSEVHHTLSPEQQAPTGKHQVSQQGRAESMAWCDQELDSGMPRSIELVADHGAQPNSEGEAIEAPHAQERPIQRPSSTEILGNGSDLTPQRASFHQSQRLSFHASESDESLNFSTPDDAILVETTASIRADQLVRRMLRMEKEKTTSEKTTSEKLAETGTRLRRVTLDGRVKHFVDSAMAVVILLNLVQMGIACDNDPFGHGWVVVDIIFASCFVLDLVFEIWLSGCRRHFTGESAVSNWFDFGIVVVAIVEIVIVLLAQSADVSQTMLSMLRIVRVMRLARILRVLRMPIFRDLLMMFDGIAGGVRTLGWSMVLLTGTLYVFAIFLRETAGESEIAVAGRPFRSLGWAWFTVFRCVMGDCSSETGEPIFVLLSQSFGSGYAVFYILVMMITNFGLFNVIIAIYVENTVVASKVNEKNMKQRRIADMPRLAAITGKLVREFIKVSDKKLRRSASFEEASQVQLSPSMFEEAIAKPRVRDLLSQMDIATADHEGLFEVLDADGGGTLEVNEIIGGLFKLRGDPRRSDVVANNIVMRALQEKVNQMSNESSIAFQQIRALIASERHSAPKTEPKRSPRREIILMNF